MALSKNVNTVANCRTINGPSFQHQSRLGQFQGLENEESFGFPSSNNRPQMSKFNEKMDEMSSEYDLNNTAEQDYDSDDDDGLLNFQ